MTEKLARHQVDPLGRPPVHFSPPSVGMTPEEHWQAMENAQIPSNIYRPDKQPNETNKQENK